MRLVDRLAGLETLGREAGGLHGPCRRYFHPGKAGQIRPGAFEAAEQLDICFYSKVRQV
jgi:hypothetical protein